MASETALEPGLREKIRLALIEHKPDADPDEVESRLNKIMTVVDPFEKSAAKMLERDRHTVARLAK